MSEIACLSELKNGKKWGGGEQKEEQKGRELHLLTILFLSLAFENERMLCRLADCHVL